MLLAYYIASINIENVYHDIVGSREWVIGNREGEEKYAEFHGIAGVAGSNEYGGDNLSANEKIPERRTVWINQPNPTGGSVNSSEHSGGKRETFQKGIPSLPVHSKRLPSRAGNTIDNSTTDNIYSAGRTEDHTRTIDYSRAYDNGTAEVAEGKSEYGMIGNGEWGIGNREETLGNNDRLVVKAELSNNKSIPNSPLKYSSFETIPCQRGKSIISEAVLWFAAFQEGHLLGQRRCTQSCFKTLRRSIIVFVRRHSALAYGAPNDGSVIAQIETGGQADDAHQQVGSLVSNPLAFRRLVRNAMFKFVELAAREHYDGLSALSKHSDGLSALSKHSDGLPALGKQPDALPPMFDYPGWDADAWADALDPLFVEQGDDAIGVGADARASKLVQILEPGQALPPGAMLKLHRQADIAVVPPGYWWVRQILDDQDGNHDWAITAVVNLAASNSEPSIQITEVGPIG